MTHHRPYPSDLSDARWELIGPALTAWRTERRGNGLDIGHPPLPWHYSSHRRLYYRAMRTATARSALIESLRR
ncbi:hypothetical protein J7E87_32100 [Streptomyces sp. ISL-1]|nr:hypothetical protein [Streptomyces sp. ISL-1]MBT2393930.1 hypothetical protein [Streptomyces sp. ISL-1]